MRWIVALNRWVASALGLLVIALTILILVDVGGRFFFNKPLKGGVEISRVVLAWILFLSLAYGLIQKAHARVSFLVDRLPIPLRFAASMFTGLVSLLFFGFGMYAGWDQFNHSFMIGEEMGAPIWIPFWLPKLALPVGCLMISLQLVLNLVSDFLNFGREQ